VEDDQSCDEEDEACGNDRAETNPDLETGKFQSYLPVVFNVLHDIFATEIDCDVHLEVLDYQVPVEARLVSLADAIADPRAVMIERRHAEINLLAVLCSEWDLKMADGAVLALNEDLDVFVFFTEFLIDLVFSSFYDCVHLVLRRFVLVSNLNVIDFDDFTLWLTLYSNTSLVSEIHRCFTLGVAVERG